MIITGPAESLRGLVAVQPAHAVPAEVRPNGAITDRKSERADYVVAHPQNTMELSQRFNLKFLMLQQEMQMENRKFTTLSNVMKTKHQTASAAISNIKLTV